MLIIAAILFLLLVVLPFIAWLTEDDDYDNSY